MIRRIRLHYVVLRMAFNFRTYLNTMEGTNTNTGKVGCRGHAFCRAGHGVINLARRYL